MTEVSDSGPLSPKDEARLHLSCEARDLSDMAAELVAIDPHGEHGALLLAALALGEKAEAVLTAAAVAEREAGTTWHVLREKAGGKKLHQYGLSGAVHEWAAEGRRNGRSPSPLRLAAELDEWFAQREPKCPKAVSSGLDAVRFPGSDAYENRRRQEAAGLHARSTELRDRASAAWDKINAAEFEDTDSGADHPATIACSDAYDERAVVHEELACVEPVLAADHQDRAARDREVAQRLRTEGPNPIDRYPIPRQVLREVAVSDAPGFAS